MSVGWEQYARDSGVLLPQVSAPAVIHRLLGRLDVRRGQRVLEIGTGSGYSAAVLAGTGAQVVSVELVPELVARAGERYARHGVQVELHVGDGRHGWPGGAPYDRIVAWATPQGGIPRAWADQLAEGGVLLAPVSVRPLTGCVVTTRWTRCGAALHGTDVLPGSFAPLDERPRRSGWSGPWTPADAVVAEDGQPRHWLSAEWIRALPGPARAVLGARTAGLEPGPPGGVVDQPAWRAYLLATGPPGLTTGYWHGAGTAVGFSGPGGLAMLTADGRWVRDGEAVSADAWLAEWERAGRPGMDRLRPAVVGTGPGVLAIRLVSGPPG